MFLGHLSKFLQIFVSILLHELGHVILAEILGAKVNSITILPIGIKASMEENALSVKKKVLVYLGGAIVNILLLLLSFMADTYYLGNTGNMGFFIFTNLCLAVFNLLPIIPLDGGNIVRELLNDKVGFIKANIYIRKISEITLIGLVSIGIVQLHNNIFNFSLILIGIYIFFIIKKIKPMEGSFMNMKQFFYRKERLLKIGAYPARDIVVMKSMKLNDVVKCMDFDRFHIVHVLDENLKLIKHFTEQEILDSLVQYHTEITFDDLIGKGSE
ncbi:MAG: site-2 protease family protein [Clostridia bacterium]|nr:site-2 protease family protein [Clostridia bacterium]